MSTGYALTADDDGRVDFDLQTSWSAKMRDAFMGSGADGLVANYARGFIGHDLEFIRDLPLRRLNVLARTVEDLSPIYDLSDSLCEFRVQAGSMTRIDLAALPHLTALSCTWDQVADTIGDARAIEELSLTGYDPSDLVHLAHLTALRSLRMKDRPDVRSLDGADSMPWLAHLAIYSAPLEDTSALARMNSPVLTELRLGSCRQITSLIDVRGLVGLRFLEMSEAGSLESLRPLAHLPLLERLYLYGSTQFTDGDLTPLLGMERMIDLRIMNRRHYTPSVQQVKAQLGITA